ncbi:hypothetical protein [Cesiribacter andamanensis]|nr:hypothetical protein [Cesiribacter andamanensis]
MSPEEFDARYQEALEKALAHMAENPEIAPSQFYSLATFLENLSIFSPVLYGLLIDSKKS